MQNLGWVSVRPGMGAQAVERAGGHAGRVGSGPAPQRAGEESCLGVAKVGLRYLYAILR